MTEKLFLDDAYLRSCEAVVLNINDRGGILPDRSNFYATSGGQPGDTGILERANGDQVRIGTTIYGAGKEELILVPEETDNLPAAGETVSLHVNWDRRYRLMRMHTALHLLCSVIPFPVTGGSIGEEESRLDFDIPDPSLDKAALSEQLTALVDADHPVSTRWITDEELEANMEMVRTMAVRPPMGTGKVRLVSIGADDAVDLQPCGGTHVHSTAEVGEVHVGKIEKKGKQNRRVRIRFGAFPG